MVGLLSVSRLFQARASGAFAALDGLGGLAGRVVLFASDPNFRAFTDGTQKILRNAVLGADPATAATCS